MATVHPVWPWILVGTDNPTSVATPAPIGMLYLNRSTGDVYAKIGAGNTAWRKIQAPQVFQYTATGAESNPFTVTLPSARSDTNYNVQITPGGPAANTIKVPRALVSTFTTTNFQIELSVAPQAGDIYMITVEDKT